MAWRIVKQPNDLLARFSDIVDDFTDANMNEREVYRLCRKEFGIDASKRKVRAGIEDHLPYTCTPSEDGLYRWRESIETIRSVHGEERVKEVMLALNLDPRAQGVSNDPSN